MPDDDSELTNADIEKSSYKVIAIRWLMHQGVVTVLLFLILAAIIWGGHYGITQAIPEHLKQIQSGYSEVMDKATIAVEKATVEHRKAVEAVKESQESERQLYRELLRIPPKPNEHGTALTRPNGEESIR